MERDQSYIQHALEPLVWSAQAMPKVLVATAAPVVKELLIPLIGRQMRKSGFTSVLWEILDVERVTSEQYGA